MPEESRIPARKRGLLRVRARVSNISSGLVLGMQEWIHAEEAAGFMLLLGTVAGLAWANSPWAYTYKQVWLTKLVIDLGFIRIAETAQHWVNDGLMVFFFLLVALEIKKELVHGDLSGWRQAALPVIAALGGMALPAGLYLAVTYNTDLADGWGIPVATDIAFALGVLALLGRRIPGSLKILLLAFATVDDVGGILIIAFFYTSHLAWPALAGAGIVTLVIAVLRRYTVRHTGLYVVLGLLLWLAMLESGVHAAIAGVVLGLLVPARRYFDRSAATENLRYSMECLNEAVKREDDDTTELLFGEVEELARGAEHPVERLDRRLRPWVSYLVLPVFALANTGIPVSGSAMAAAAHDPAAQGIALGLLVGKFCGVLAAIWLAVRFGVAKLPANVNWRHITGISLLAGIGFTVSLFIADLAFRGRPELAEAKIAILVVSAVAGLAGFAFLALTTRANGKTRAARNASPP
jgi:NhaA family Na+:H+ antiporter